MLALPDIFLDVDIRMLALPDIFLFVDIQMLTQILTLPDVNTQISTSRYEHSQMHAFPDINIQTLGNITITQSQTPTLQRKILPPLLARLASHLIPQILPAAKQCLDPLPTLRPPPNPHTMALEGFLDSVRERHTASNASSP